MAFCDIWFLGLIIVSAFVSLDSPGFGMLTCLAGLNGDFPARSCSAVCSDHLRLAPSKE
jgi:hypothetical protein